MLRNIHEQGIKDALAQFGVKEAWFEGTKDWLRNVRANPVKTLGEAAKSTGHALVGHPFEAISQLARGTAFKPEGLLNLRKNLWGGGWLNRIMGIGMPAYGAIQALRGQGDPNEGRLSNALGAVGSGLGFTLGYPAAGMLGVPYVAEAGQRLGKGLGHLLGSRPTPPPTPPSPPSPPQMMYQQQPTSNDLYNPIGGY